MPGAWSIRRRLPLLLVAVLVLIVATLMAASYAEVRTQTLAAVEERLQRLASQIGAAFNTPVLQRQLERFAATAGAPPVIDLLAGRAASEAEALAVLDAIPGADTTAIGLWSADGSLVLEASGRPHGILAGLSPLVGEASSISALRAVDDSVVFYDVVAPVRIDGRIVGSVTARRRIVASTAPAMRLIFGPSGGLLIGNQDGSLWIDGPSVAAAPPASVLSAQGLVTFERDGRAFFGAVASAPPTPWRLLAEVGRAEALAPATAYLQRILLIAGMLLALGGLSAWALSRRLTAPLDTLAKAVSGISAGDYSTRVALEAPSEVAELGSAVNSMAEQVQDRTLDLASSEARFRSLVNATAQIVWHARPDGTVEGALPAWQAYTGQTDAQVAGVGWMNAVHADDRPRFTRIWDEALQADGPFGFECRIRGEHGPYRLFSVRGVPVRSMNGSIREWVGTCQDVEQQRAAERELRRAEDELRHAKKMEAIGRLAGGVAHDFNNILTGILAPATFAREQLGDSHPVTPDIDAIRTAALKAAELTKQLLTFSRAKSLRLAVLDLNEVVQESVQLLKRIIGENIEVRVSLSEHISPVRADRAQLDQVLLNLAVNARDAMPKGGTVTIETTGVELTSDYVRQHPSVRAGMYVMLAVSDNGCGMDEATRERIFEPFFTTKEPGKGTGLGLATVHGIVQQAGGHVWVYSEPGVGSTFKVYLPAVEAHVAAAQEVMPKERAVVGGSEGILLVEDDERVRSVAVRSLQLFGYQVHAAANGHEALATLGRRDDIELVVTDMVMPGMSGAELASTVRATRPELPILFLSGYAEAAVVERDALRDDEPFLAKPYTPEELARAVRALLDAKRSQAALAVESNGGAALPTLEATRVDPPRVLRAE